jgi:4-amino-4-deoxy-L-arabinose transferase-like glycosyltransferase
MFSFWGLGSHGVRIWDEARYGENALEMLQNGDFINYYFDGKPDDWVAKPPLGIWFIALSYKIFGFNEWALRLPAALAAMGTVITTFKLVRLYRGAFTAATCCFILITCQGLIGMHVGRTGDLDALFVFTTLTGIYFIARYLKGNKGWTLLAAGCFFGLSFFSKGFMLGMVFPGIGLAVLVRGKVMAMLTDKYFWGSLGILGAFIVSWYLCIKFYGTRFEGSAFGKDAWDTMLNYDLLGTYSRKLEGDNTTSGFIFSALDVRFTPWIYLIYGCLISLGYRIFRGGRKVLSALRSDELFGLCASMAFATLLVLGNSETKYNWYLAITIPFLAILTFLLLRVVAKRASFHWRLLGMIAVLAFFRQTYFTIYTMQSLPKEILDHEELIAGANHVYSSRSLGSDSNLALKFRNHVAVRTPELLAAGEAVTEKIFRVNDAQGYSVVLKPGPKD